MKWLAAFAFAMTVTVPAHASTPPADNAEMTAIYTADQADRDAGAKIDWSVVLPRDTARRGRTKALLDGGALASADDFYHAAYVFQHGDKPGDFLLAHTLAMVAAARGSKQADALGIASATLDRYLQRIGQKQIYGTQYLMPKDAPATQEPYDRTLVSDRLRAALGLRDLAAQEKLRQELDAEYRGARK